MKRVVLILITGATVGAMAQTGYAAPKPDPVCSVSPSSSTLGATYVVSASGIPTGTAINLWVTDATGTVGSPLGSTPDGTFNLNESSQTAGTVTYQFSGPVKQRTQFYATCSVEVY